MAKAQIVEPVQNMTRARNTGFGRSSNSSVAASASTAW